MDFLQVNLELLKGFKTTFLLFFLTLVLSMPLGLIFSFGSMSKLKPLQFLTRGFIYIIRGTPLLLQLMIIIYLPGILKHPIVQWPIFGGNQDVARFSGVLFGFVINYACYFSEIFRGGIQSISVGQYEAGQVLGMTKSQIFFKVILIQVFKRVLPPISNETITLVKDTALVRIVSVYELLFFAEQILNTKFLIWPLFYTGVFYLVFNAVLTYFFNRLETKLTYFKS